MQWQGKAGTLVHATKYVLDPNIIGTGANILAAVQGSIATSGSAPDVVWRVNADEIATYDAYSPIIDIEFPITVPAAPTSGDVRAWGLKSPGLGNRGRIEFDITGSVFSARPYDETGTLLTVRSPSTGQALASNAITWDAAWTNTLVRYRIQHFNSRINFLINETVYAYTDVAAANPGIPNHGHIINSNADNMDVRAIIIRNAFNM